MKSCQQYLSELRDKLATAEDHLRVEKKNLYRSHELFTEEKEKWANEIKAEEALIRSNEIQIKEKEEELQKLKADYENLGREISKLELENEELTRDIQKGKREQERKMSYFLLEQGCLERELVKVQEQMKDVKSNNKWMKVFQNKELKAQETDEEDHLKEEMTEMSRDLNRKIDMYQDNLKEIDKTSLWPKKERVAVLREALENINKECQEMEEKCNALEKQIELLQQK